MSELIVAEASIRKDVYGRYCLNDLHRAAGGESKRQPSFFAHRDEAKELIEELSSANIQNIIPQKAVIPAIQSK